MIRLCVCVLLVSVCWSFPLSGWIQSPGYPHGYGAHANVTWRRCAPPGHTLSLTLVHLDMEESYLCENDALQIFKDDHLFNTFCGQMTLQKLQSSVNPSLRSRPGGCISLSFQSDYSNTKRHTGFRAFYTTYDVDECWENLMHCSQFCHNYIGGYSCSCKPGFILDEDQHTCRANCTEDRYGDGVLVSPGSPGPYSENADCSYHLSVDPGNQIELEFSGVFDLETRDGRCIDYVMIKTNSRDYGPFCGREKPRDIHTSSQSVEVIFHSDENEGAHEGFTLNYKPKPMECPRHVTNNADFSPVSAQYKVGATVTVQCKTGHIWEDPDKTTYKSRCQLNGMWDPVHICRPVDCGHLDLPELVELTEEDPPTTYGHSISVRCPAEFYHLVGEESFTCNSNGEWVTGNGELFSQNASKCVPVCGVFKGSASGKIFGGEKAKLGQIPWQLLIKTPRGGGSLISDRWALTAAHVVEKQKSVIFYGGMVDGQDKNKVEMETEKIIIHPGYKTEAFDNDIALVKMSSRVQLSENILPVCLPEGKTKGPVMEGMMGTVSGYGGVTEKRPISRYLMYGHVKEYSEVPCFKTHIRVTDNMFCAGDADRHVDSCKGDSGGPLVIPMVGFGSQDRPYRLKGIVSWGPEDCGDVNSKGYYTKVENYLDWIRETMEKN